MSKREYSLFLKDILTGAEKILKYVNDKPFEEFAKDEMLTDAVIRNLEIIGEAVKNLPDDIKQRYADVEWKKVAGLRDMLIHEYFGIDYEVLWDIIKNKIPPLKERMLVILNAEKKTENQR